MEIDLSQLSGWELREDHLVKTFEFKGFNKVMSFVNAVAWVANKQNHHPDIHLSFKTVTIKMTTHDAGNRVTDKDLRLAKEIDLLLN